MPQMQAPFACSGRVKELAKQCAVTYRLGSSAATIRDNTIYLANIENLKYRLDIVDT